MSEPARFRSHAVIVTSLSLLVTVMVLATVSAPLLPVASESALITSAWLDAAPATHKLGVAPAAAATAETIEILDVCKNDV